LHAKIQNIPAEIVKLRPEIVDLGSIHEKRHHLCSVNLTRLLRSIIRKETTSTTVMAKPSSPVLDKPPRVIVGS